MRFTLGKEEKLKSKILIGQLFAEGNRVKSYPFQLVYLQKDLESKIPLKVGFTVPKRSVKLAVNRIRIKRLMREVFRKNKHLITENINEQYIFMLVYTTNKEIEYADLELAIQNVCGKFLLKISKNEQD